MKKLIFLSIIILFSVSCSTTTLENAKCDNSNELTTKQILDNVDSTLSVSIVEDNIYLLDSTKTVAYGGVLLEKSSVTVETKKHEIVEAWLLITCCPVVFCLWIIALFNI